MVFLEAAHYVVSATSSRAFSGKAASSLPEREASEMLDLWRQCLADATISTEDFITGWFAPADRYKPPRDGTSILVSLDALQRDNVAEWLSYALYATATSAITDEQTTVLDEAITLLEERLTKERRRKHRRERRRSKVLHVGGNGGTPVQYEQEDGAATTMAATRASSMAAVADDAVGAPMAAGRGGGGEEGGFGQGGLAARVARTRARRRARRRAAARRDAFHFPPGFNKEVRSFRLNLDPPAYNIKARPLFYYALTDGLLCGLVTPAVMKRRGFTLHRQGSLSYWYHPGDAEAAAQVSTAEGAVSARRAGGSRAPPEELLERTRGQRGNGDAVGDAGGAGAGAGGSSAVAPPIVFVHGVGLGPLPYFGFVDEMLRNGRGAPMLVLELPFVSQRLSKIHHAPHEERTTREIAEALARHGITSATFVGHSLGTVYLAWLARLQPQLLASCVFIDPIVFLLHHHKVAQSFLYSRPTSTNLRGHVEHYFIKSEHSIVSFFHRHFYWFANILWAHQLPAPSAVILADSDRIVPVDAVEAYLRSESQRRHVRRVTVLEKQSHGSFLVDKDARDEVLQTVRDAQLWGAMHARRRSANLRSLHEAAAVATHRLGRWCRAPLAAVAWLGYRLSAFTQRLARSWWRRPLPPAPAAGVADTPAAHEAGQHVSLLSSGGKR